MALNAPYTPNTVIQSTQVSNDLVGLANGSNDTPTNSMQTFRQENMANNIASGCVWSGDSYGGTRNASMTAGVVYINGVRLTVALVTGRLFTASRDTYVDSNSSGVLVYTEVTNNAVSPALAANSIRIAIIVTGASNIAAATSVNQGQGSALLPTGLIGGDSLGNFICPRGGVSSSLTQVACKFYVYRTAAMTSANVNTVVPYDTKVYDTGANVDVVTNKGRFTAPVAGFYWLCGIAGNTAATSTIMQTSLYKNGSQIIAGSSVDPSLAASSGTNLYATGLIQLKAGDYVEVYYVGGNGSTMGVGIAGAYFMGYLVSET